MSNLDICIHCGHPIAPDGVYLDPSVDVDTSGNERGRCDDSSCVAQGAEQARAAFIAAAKACGSDPATEEDAILSIGREFLPACAIAVLDKTGPATAEYWDWLRDQTEQAQAEHDAAIAAGHEWHQ